MPLTKATGNMYSWVDYTHTHLGGKCLHNCSYCYVQRMSRRFNNPRYQGPLRLVEKECHVNYGEDRTIFVEHCNDLFQKDVPWEWINRVMFHCREYPLNRYVFQTKNPLRAFRNIYLFPGFFTIGTTLETTFKSLICQTSDAPFFVERVFGMLELRDAGVETFVTIEPIMDMNVSVMLDNLQKINPAFVNIGADSKGTGLDEPTKEGIEDLITGINSLGIEIRVKSNLARLRKGGKKAK